MIITVGATKGGCGKSTTALQLCAIGAQRGFSVWAIDGDRQLTLQTALTYRAEAVVPQVAVSAYADGKTLRSQVEHQRANFDHVVIDVGGYDSTALRAALAVTDLFLMPFLPRSFDVWAVGSMADLIEETRSYRDGLDCAAFLNRADHGAGADNAEAKEILTDYPQFRLLSSALGNRKIFADSAGSGLGVGEWKKKNPTAQAEIDNLVSELELF